jgi:cysteine-S-conjugate beta-lyase
VGGRYGLPSAQPIIDAHKKRVEHPFYGYTQPGSNVIDAVVDRMWRKFKGKLNQNG